jgi:hypothetical protein
MSENFRPSFLSSYGLQQLRGDLAERLLEFLRSKIKYANDFQIVVLTSEKSFDAGFSQVDIILTPVGWQRLYKVSLVFRSHTEGKFMATIQEVALI